MTSARCTVLLLLVLTTVSATSVGTETTSAVRTLQQGNGTNAATNSTTSSTTGGTLEITIMEESNMDDDDDVTEESNINDDETAAATTSSGEDTFDNEERVIVTDQAMGARCAVAADFDGDGLLDIVSASSNDNAVSWFRNEGIDPNSGLPSFSIKKQITWSSLGSRIVTVADIDSDGDMDVIGASYYDKSLRWFENDGTGQFTPHLISSGVFEGQGVAVADVNNDGQPDVISASSGDNTIAVFKNIDRGVFCEIKDVVDDNAIGARTVIAVDLNGDGWVDLASASKDDDTVAWYPNDGAGNFPRKLIVSAGNHSKGAYSLVAADIDQDGHQDLIVASNGNDRVTLWRNNGKGEFTPTVVFDDADFVLSVTAIDFDKDGDLDIASASFFDGHINWYENVDGKGNVWKNHTIYIGTQGHYVSTADLDNDGDADLIAVTHAENTVAVFLAHTKCDNQDRGEDCCLVGTEWNGTLCQPCPFGTYGHFNNGGCVACPTDSCTIEGYTHLPATCSGIAACGDVEASVASCTCPEDSMKDPETDVCVACPDGQIRPDFKLQRKPNTLGNYSVWEDDQGICYVHQSTSYTPLLITVAVVGALLVVALCVLLYRQQRLSVKNSLWKIKEEELIYDQPVVVLGKGSFGEVVLADYRGTKVAVKALRPNLLAKCWNSTVGNAKVNEDDPEAGLDTSDEKSSAGDEPSNTAGSVCSGSSVYSSIVMPAGGYEPSSTKSVTRTKGKWSLAGGWFSREGDTKDEFVKEIRMLSQLPEHRNIVCVMGATKSNVEDPKLVMEYMERGSLYDLLRSNIPIGGQLIRNILKDVTQGMRFLHRCDPQVVHSDLKSSNILIDDRWRAKISDFGWGTAGTPYWTAPEVLRGDTPYTPASDVYALGITMYEMYARKLPYQGENPKTMIEKIKKKNKRPQPPSTMSQKVAFMFKDCIVRKAHMRPTLDELSARIDRLVLADFEYQSPAGNNKDKPGGPVLFPPHVSEALSKGHSVEPEVFKDATVFYCEIADFTELSSKLTPMKLADMMHRFFDRVDVFADQHGVFKVDMVGGGAWMGATNVVQHQPNDHIANLVQFAMKAMEAASVTLVDEDDTEKGYLQVRAAFITGPIEGRVVGVRKPRYSLYGSMVEAATFLASKKADPGKIVCVEADQQVLEAQLPNLTFEVMARTFVPGLDNAATLFCVRW